MQVAFSLGSMTKWFCFFFARRARKTPLELLEFFFVPETLFFFSEKRQEVFFLFIDMEYDAENYNIIPHDMVKGEEGFAEEYTPAKNKRKLSMFHHEKWRSMLSEKLSELSLAHKEERQKLFPKNVFLMNEDERETIIQTINEQLVDVGKEVGEWLKQKHEEEAEEGGEIINLNYALDPISLCYGDPEFKNKRQKMVVVLASPTLSQIDNQHIDPNQRYSNGLRSVQDKLSLYPGKSHSFVFSIPFFLGSDTVKQEILSTPGFLRPLLIYTRDVMRALNPSSMTAITSVAFERCLNRFEEKNAKETIRSGSSLFFSHMNDSLKGECKIAVIPDNPITCYYLPHPYTLGTKNAKPSVQQDWNGTWALIEQLWGAKNSIFQTSFVNPETKTENKDASDYLKKEAASFYEKKIKKKKDPVRKLPKGKRVSIGMDTFVKKQASKKPEEKQ